MGTVSTNTERAAAPVVALGELLKDHQAFVVSMPWGPTDYALAGSGWNFVADNYLGFDEAAIGPLSIFKAIQNGVGSLAIARVVGAGAERASASLLDHRGRRSVMLFGRWVGDISKVTLKNIRAQALSIVSTANAAGTVTSSKRALAVDSPGKFQIGDVCYVTDGTNVALITIYGIDGATGDLLFTAPVMLVGSTVAVGATVTTVSEHLLQTRLASALAPGSTSALLDSSTGAYVGQEIVVQHATDNSIAPIELVITGVNGKTISFVAPGGSDTFPVGGRVSSIETRIEVQAPGRKSEEFVYSLAETFTARYLNNVLGQSVSFSIGSTITTLKTGQSIADNAVKVNVTSFSGLTAGEFYRIAEGSNYLLIHLKSKSLTDTINFDDVGDITLFTDAATVALATPTFVQGRNNDSKFVLGAELNYSGGQNNATTEKRYRLPRPIEGVAMTGGLAGSAPTGLTECLGSSVEATMSGAYLFDKLPERGRIDGLWCPGLDHDDVDSRAALEDAYQDFASTRKMTFGGSTPSTVTTGERTKTYITDDLGLDTSYEALYPGWVGIDHPEQPGVVVEIPPDGFAAGVWSRRARRGIHVPPGNERLIGVKYLVMEVDDGLAKTIEELGSNLIRRLGVRGFVLTTTRTLYRNEADGTKRSHLNVRRWLNWYERTLEEGLQPLLEEVGNEQFFDAAELPQKDLLDGEFRKGVFGPKTEADAYSVNFDDLTNTTQKMAVGKFRGVNHVSPAPAVRDIEIETVIHEGSVRVREAA